jgi:hypothetical protein
MIVLIGFFLPIRLDFFLFLLRPSSAAVLLLLSSPPTNPTPPSSSSTYLPATGTCLLPFFNLINRFLFVSFLFLGVKGHRSYLAYTLLILYFGTLFYHIYATPRKKKIVFQQVLFFSFFTRLYCSGREEERKKVHQPSPTLSGLPPAGRPACGPLPPAPTGNTH